MAIRGKFFTKHGTLGKERSAKARRIGELLAGQVDMGIVLARRMDGPEDILRLLLKGIGKHSNHQNLHDSVP